MRRVKIGNRPREETPEVNADEAGEGAPAISTKKVIRTTREEFTAPARSHDEAKPTPAPEADDDTRDELGAFLEQLDAEHGLIIRVDRLPEFTATGMWGKGAPVEYCGDLSVTKETLLGGIYLQQIQREYGGGSYRLSLRYTSNARMIRRWPERIAAPRDDTTVAGPGNTRITIHGAGKGEAPLDALAPIKQFAETAKQFKALIESLNLLPGASAPVANPAPVEVRAPTFEERLLTAAMEAAVSKGDEAGIDRLVDKVLGKKGGGDWGEVVITKIVEAVGPKLPELINSLAQFFLPARPAPPVAVEQPAPASPRAISAPRRLGPHGYNEDPATGACRVCRQAANHLIHSGLSPVSAEVSATPEADEAPGLALVPEIVWPGNEDDAPPEGEEEFAMYDDLIDGLLALLIGAHMTQQINEEALQNAVDAVREFADSNILFKPFVDALINGDTGTILGMALGRRPDLAAQMGDSALVKTAIERLQSRLRERGR